MTRSSFLCLLLFYFQSCQHAPNVTPITTSQDYKKGESLIDKRNDSAFYYFNRVTTTSTERLLIAQSYNEMAIIQADAGDYFGSQENLLASLKYLNKKNEKDRDCLFSDYNELGTSSLNMKNYEASIGYYNEAVELATNADSKIISLSNKALCYQKLRQYPQSIAIYQSIINQTKNNKKRYARILTNLAYTKWLRDSSFHAGNELFTALRIRKNENDNWGLNASYAHLSDYYSFSQPDSGFIYAKKMYAVAKELNSPDDVLEALEKLIKLAPAVEAKDYFTRYEYLNDSLQTSRNNAKNQFALIKYDATKNREDNLILLKDNAEKRVRIIGLLVGLFATVIIAVAAFFRYSKQKQEDIRKQQLKTSQKVHDVVANGLYRLMTKIEHGPTIEKEQLLDDIDDLYERSRDISYEKPENIHKEEPITKLLESFGNDATRVLIVGDTSEIWTKLATKTKKELTLVLQELMTNMKKHSLAKNVAVKFEAQENYLIVSYTDDGVGLTNTFRYGNGLKNTENRIKSIGGSISFGETTTGLKIRIHVPIA